MNHKILLTTFAIHSILFLNNGTGQIFTRVTSTANPIVTASAENYYSGASWIDYDNDGLLDLFVIRGGLYHNDGSGNFSKITSSGLGLTTGIGNTWADVDNDGAIDCLQSGGNAGGSKLFMNNGNSTFIQNTSGPFSVDTNLRGWGSAFGDYNNDGLVDLFIAAPIGFASVTDSNKFLVNTGAGSFVRVDSTVVTDTLDAFTVPSWSDYDNDGDIDLFIGSGRVNGSLSRDFLYENKHIQGGNPLFTRINSSPLGSDLHDGQVWNWIDFDNDGDLDGYLTNYSGTTPATGYQNEMYRNDNNTFVKLTATDVGPIVTDLGISLANTWGDFDNDGDLDCVVTNEGMQKNVYYQSNVRQGSTVFTKITNEPFVINNGDHWCATSGDYDHDGDLDLFISGNSDRGLFENNTTQTIPSENFINIKLIGITSNKSGIGGKLRIYANGFWQMREISAQNTFNGMNMLNSHFGFGNSITLPLLIDTIKIEWPSGTVDLCSNIYANAFYVATEGQCLTATSVNEINKSSETIFLISVFPNPANEVLSFNYSLTFRKKVTVTLADETGKIVFKNVLSNTVTGKNNSSIDIKKLPKGFYTLMLSNGKDSSNVTFVKQ